MATPRPIVVVEIDVPQCTLTYASAPCAAVLGVTGAIKCFNSTRTCQDKENFTRGTLTLRFTEPFPDLTFDAYPALVSVNVTPNVIDPGMSMGTRATVKVSIDDFQSSDAGLDKYLADRAYDPFTQGTFWPKLRARVPSFESYPLRVLRGDAAADLSTFVAEHYVIDTAVNDPGGIGITAKDPLSLCDAKKAQAPVLSNGRLLVGIDADDMTFTLTPAGIGDLEYPASGKGCLSGKEVVTFTRIADAVTITARAVDGTQVDDHEDSAIFQLCVVYASLSAADIIYDLLVTYTPGIDPSWINLPAWQTEVDTYIGNLYGAVLPAPTAVNTLINEVIEQAGLSLWWDAVERRIELQSLRPVVPEATQYDDDLIEAGTLALKEQPDQRVSQAWTYYGLANVVNKLDKESNFRAAIATLNDQNELDYDVPAIRKTLSRWISVTNRPAAERLNQMLISRFADGPRAAVFAMHPTVNPKPQLGTGITLAAAQMQDATGVVEAAPFYVVSVDPTQESYEVRAVELKFFNSIPGSDRSLFLDVDAFNVNLFDLYNSLYADIPDAMVLRVYLGPGVLVGSATAAQYAFTVPDDFPVDSTIIIYIAADAGMIGAGGKGGDGNTAVLIGLPGGPGLLVERVVEIVNLGTVAGGGGGGGSVATIDGVGGGGGGAGYNALVGGLRQGGLGGAIDGTFGRPFAAPPEFSTAYGGGGTVDGPAGTYSGGDGGDLAMNGGTPYAGVAGTAFAGGAAGAAVDGDSFITWTTLGTVLGARNG